MAKPSQTYPTTFALRLPQELRGRLQEEAERDDRSLNKTIVRMLTESLDHATDQPKPKAARRR